MARKAKGQLPSGNIRIQKVVSVSPDGKRKFKSFTGRTRAEAEYLYSRWLLNCPEEKKRSLTLSEAVRRYIDAKEDVLSPSTIVGYGRILHQYVSGAVIGQADLSSISTKDMQLWISDLSGRGLSPKTVRNAYMLVKSSILLFNPDYRDSTKISSSCCQSSRIRSWRSPYCSPLLVRSVDQRFVRSNRQISTGTLSL